jgi:predicted dehydrogenase
MSAERLRVGIIGAGGIVKSRHLPALREIAGVDVVAVSNRSRESGEAVAREWSIPEVVNDWRALVERPDLHAIFIGTWPYTHAEMSVAALDAGKHVFCQARMARDLAEARQMLAAAERRPKQVAMLCPGMANGTQGDPLIRHLIGQGYLGELREVHLASITGAYADPQAPLHWRQNFALSGYNTLSLGIKIEAVHRWVGAHRKVAAVTRVQTPMRRDAATGEMVPVRIADSVAIAAELANGAAASYHFSGVARWGPEDRIDLIGTDGWLSYDWSRDELHGATGDMKKPELIAVPADLRRTWTAEGDFIEAIRTGGMVEPSFADGVRYMEFTEAVYRSAESGRVVELPLPLD